MRQKDKQRCVIFHGAVDSGKTWIAKIMNRIFISYSKRQPKGMFDERLSELETNVQLVIQNEVPMRKMFTLKNMPEIKLYTEGDGIQVENKYGHPFTGFVNTHQLFTCNALVCPFIEPTSSNSGWTMYDNLFENDAMNTRSRLVKFTDTHEDLRINFEDKEWAQCMLFMAENINNIPKPE